MLCHLQIIIGHNVICCPAAESVSFSPGVSARFTYIHTHFHRGFVHPIHRTIKSVVGSNSHRTHAQSQIRLRMCSYIGQPITNTHTYTHTSTEICDIMNTSYHTPLPLHTHIYTYTSADILSLSLSLSLSISNRMRCRGFDLHITGPRELI